MLDSGSVKKERKNPNDPARFIGKVAAATDGEVAQIHNYLDEEKIQNETRIKAHFLTCFISLVIYRYLEKALGDSYTCDTILSTLKSMNFACVQE